MLFKMLKFTLKRPVNEELNIAPELPSLVPFGDVVGCLAVHIKQCKDFTSKFHKHSRSKLVVRIVVNRIVKFTKPHHLRSKTNKKVLEVKFDEVRYFSVQVPRRREDERNNIFVELVEIESSGNLRLLGCFSIHLYEIIWKGSFTEEFEMKARNLVFCRVEVAFMFSYGNFGYGFSHQLKPFPKLMEPSMFIRVPPPLERADPLMNVIMPQPVEYPAFLSADLKVTIGTPDKENQISTKCVQLEKLQQPPRERLGKMKSEYRSLKTWDEKANYLDRILIMKAGPLSQGISKECRFPGIVESISYFPTFEAGSVSSMSSEASELEEELTFLNEEKRTTSESQSTVEGRGQELGTPVPTSPEKPRPKEPVLPVASRSDLTVLSSSSKRSAAKDQKTRGSSSKTEAKVRGRPADDQSSGADQSSCSFESETKLTGSLTSQDTDDVVEQKIATSKESLVSRDYSESFQQNMKEIPVGERRGSEQQDGPIRARLRRSTVTAEAMEHEDQDPPSPTDPSGTETETPETSRGEHVPALSRDKPPDPETDTPGEAPIGEEEFVPDVSISSVEAESPLSIDTTLSRKEPEASESSLWQAQVMLCPNSYLNSLQGQLLERLQDLFIMKSFLNKSLQGLLVAVFSPTKGKPEEENHFPSILERPPDGWQIKLVDEGQYYRRGQFSGTDVLRLTLGDVPQEARVESGLNEGGEAEMEEAGSSPPLPEERQPEEEKPISKKCSSKKKHLESPAVGSEPTPSPDLQGRLTESPTETTSVSETDLEGKSAGPSGPGSGTQTPEKHRLDFLEKAQDPWEGGRPETDGDDPAALNQILQELPIEVLLETGLIKVVELDQGEPPVEETQSSVPEKTLPESGSDYSFENLPEAAKEFPPDRGPRTEPSPIFQREDAGEDAGKARDASPAEGEADLPQKEREAHREEISKGKDLGSFIMDFSNNLIAKLSDSDKKSLKSLLGQILQSCVTEALLGPEVKSEAQVEEAPPSFPLPGDEGNLKSGGTENRRGRPRKTVTGKDRVGLKPALGESLLQPLRGPQPPEMGKWESETRKHPRDGLAGRPTEPGEIADADAEKTFRTHSSASAKTRPRRFLEADVPLQRPVHFTERFPEIEKEIQSFLNEAHHPLLDRHLESDLKYLKSFLGEILECHLDEKLFEAGSTAKMELEELLQNLSSSRGMGGPVGPLLRSRTSPTDRSEETARRGPKPALSQSLQDLLSILSEKELLKLKSGLSKYLQNLFLERLSRSGLLTETELGKIHRNLSQMNAKGPARQIVTPLPARGTPRRESKSAKTPKRPLQDLPLEKLSLTGLVREMEREGQPFSWHHTKGKSPSQPSLTGLKPIVRKGAPEPPAGTPPGPLPGTVVVHQERRERGWLQLRQEARSGKSLEIETLAQERVNLYNVTARADAERIPPPAPGAPIPGVLRDRPPGLAPSLMNVNIIASLGSRDLPHQPWGKGREKKKPRGPAANPAPGPNPAAPKKIAPFAQYRKEIRHVSVRVGETCREKGGEVSARMASRPGLRDVEGVKSVTFPDVLKGETPKSKVSRERTWDGPAKEGCCTPVRKEDASRATVQHLERAKKRAKLDLGKFPEDAPDGHPGPAKPNPASDPNRLRREPGTRKSPGPGVRPPGTPSGQVSLTAGPDADGSDDQKGQLERNLEKCSMVCEILHLLNENLKSRD
ncbi:C2 calcium-dependent domain-containing protein 6 isoform X2 [Tachyglossus aculeatus]|uniref:C2 calcium-dependent domain-containing protein 6 isoform X2 n=1 Tax=Tachyglossus aculeatus TaxID=9261 RepID=UPI0018F712DD|nr:C2 calcium-dependent domain-containing protein 6 isoform X2 [Tachyglossus aculeatus]